MRRSSPWYLWPLVPPVGLIVAVVVGIPLGILVLLSLPLFWLYPDGHLQVADAAGTPEQKAQVAKWRAAYRRLSFAGRMRRAVKLSVRRRRQRAP